MQAALVRGLFGKANEGHMMTMIILMVSSKTVASYCRHCILFVEFGALAFVG